MAQGAGEGDTELLASCRHWFQSIPSSGGLTGRDRARKVEYKAFPF